MVGRSEEVKGGRGRRKEGGGREMVERSEMECGRTHRAVRPGPIISLR